jgi:predicted unusual protein kinase regulating ubiquinone biosynthesis (AarF/ABC1/UbiB family)
MEKDGGIGKRIVRTGKVSGTMAGLAAKLAGEKFFGLDIDRDQHAQALVLALGNLKGPLMKVGQILATIPEALPKEYAEAFRQLQSDAPPMGWPFVKRRMKAELGEEWEGKFTAFSREAAAAASLGQVHKATSLKGENLACKLQYPDMASAVDSDLSQLKMILGLYEKYDPSIKTQQIHAELSERLREELDYEREARHQALYEFMLRDEQDVHVPRVHKNLSTARLLTSDWVEGRRILEFTDADQPTKARIALNLFRAWYVPLYYYGIIHGDPHPGNYTVRSDLSINLLDFGCVRIFPPKFVGGVIDLYRALQTQDTALAVHAYETWGFTGLSKDQVETLNIWAGFLYGPILEDKVRVIGKAEGQVYGRETAEKVHQKLRELSRQKGGIAIPREFVFMDRAALGLGSIFIHLAAEINWHRLFEELTADFTLKTLEKRQKDALKTFHLD